jgi:anaerobic ribonucleoside-triphosphate reductase activating protein
VNYCGLVKNDVLNGEGFRVSLFVSGCNRRCKGCHSPHTWCPCAGELFDDNTKQEIFKEVSKSHYNGISILGGDPLMPYNEPEVLLLLKEFKMKFPSKTVWLWTGDVFENIKNHDIINYIDTLVDGRFILELRNLSLNWRGSENQRIIDVKKSLINGEVILATEYYEVS